MKISGVKAHLNRLKRMADPKVRKEIGDALVVGATLIEVTAERLITAGSVSGLHHIASNPGEPPHNDTGSLVKDIELSRPETLKAIVSSSAPHAIPLELGTSRMAARPYLKPAVAMKRDQVQRFVAAAVEKAIKGA